MSATDRRAAWLPDSRMLIFHVDVAAVDAVVIGERVSHRVWWTPEEGWHCGCAARTDRCGHIAAVRTVVVLEGSTERGEDPPEPDLDDQDDDETTDDDDQDF